MNDKNGKKTATYTPLTEADVQEMMELACDVYFHDHDLAEDVADYYAYTICNDPEGVFCVVGYEAASWWDAYAFQAAVVGAAAARGLYACVWSTWKAGVGGTEDGVRQRVSVVIVAADYMDKDGRAVA